MADRSVFLGLDLGTSGVRVVAVDRSGAIVEESGAGYPLLTPQPGWTEQDANQWWAACLSALRDLMAKLGDARRPDGLSFSGQMHGMVPLDAEGLPLRPALLWNDQRTGDQVAAIERAIPRATLIRRTGNRAATGFQLPKVLWLRDREPERFSRMAKALLPKDFIAYRLTGAMATEPSDGSGTGCFHLANKDWDDDILAAVGLSRSLFPEIVASTAVVGRVTGEVARVTGLPDGLPVVAGAGDNAAAATGLGISNRFPSRGSVSLGTSGVIFMPLAAPTPEPEGRVHLFCHADGNYHLLGVTLSAAGSLQWFRDTLSPDTEFDALIEEAAGSEPGARGAVFRPYLAGERTPHMDPALRASWSGLSLASTRADLVRSVLEGVAFSLRDAYDLITPLRPIEALVATGGGARSDLWLQMVSDVLQVPLLRPRSNQGAAFGAALLAMIGTGAIESVYDVLDATAAGHVQLRPGDASLYAHPLERYRADMG